VHFGDHLLSELNFTDIGQFFSGRGAADTVVAAGLGSSFGLNSTSSPRARSKAFTDWLSSLTQRTLTLNMLVSDHYLNHQAATPHPRDT
jgi:hypothetical protein